MKINFQGIECILRKGKYANGRIALYLEDAETFQPVAKCTTNIPTAKLNDGDILIKDYMENTGILDALVQSGVVTKPTHFLKIEYPSHSVLFPIVHLKKDIER